MSDEVQVALITATATVAVAFLGLAGAILPILLNLRRRLGIVQEHVANSHFKEDGTPLNLRDDLDGKHDANSTKLTTILNRLAWIMMQLADHDDRLGDLEDTQQKGTTHE